VSGVETTLKRQLGVNPQVDMDEAVIWFKWEKDEPLAPWRVNKAVVDGGMGLTKFLILGRFEFAGGEARGPHGLSLAFKGEAPEAGRWTVQIYDYEQKDGTAKVAALEPYFEPKVYNANR
jgi:hypothetical protein